MHRLLAVWLLLISISHGAINSGDSRAPFTAKEIAQGYRDGALLAMPHTGARATVDAAEAREGVRVRRKFSRFGDLRVLEHATNETTAGAIARLKATGRYEFVEPDYLRKASVLPDDPHFTNGEQWNLNNTGQSAGIAGADIKAPAAWDIQSYAANVIVAVIDSGIHATHEDIAANLWTNAGENPGNGLDDDHDGYIDDVHGINAIITKASASAGNPNDDNGHGSHVAGIIGATGNNGVGISGVVWRVQIMSLKFLDSTGSGALSDEIECFDYAIAHGAHIINGSFGDSTGSSSFAQSELAAVTRARDAGIIFVAASGNSSANLDIARSYPSSFPLDNIVSVGSSNRRDESSLFSNYGSGAVDIFAPGEEILSLGYTSASSYVLKNGTSMAAPHVTGALALLKAKFPGDNYHQLINRLYRGVDKKATLAAKAQTGGRLNVAAALSTTDNRPFNDDFAARAKISGDNIAARASSTGATRESGEPAHAGVSGGASLWWEWTASSTGSVTVDTSGSNFDTVLAIYTGTALANLTPIASNDDSGGITSRVAFTAQAGATYVIAVDGKSSTDGLVLLNIGTFPANDAFASPVTLNGTSALVTAANSHCSRETSEPHILGNTGGLSLWYRWTAPVSGHIQVSVFSAEIDPLLAVYTGSALGSLTLVTANDNSGLYGVNPSSLCTFNATAGITYMITVDSKAASVPGTFTLSLVDSLWQASATDGITGSPTVAPDGSIYVGSTDSSLYAFNSDGTQKWSYATGGFIDTCSPAIADDGTIYTGSNDGKVRAFNPDGTLKWPSPFTVPTPADTSLTNSVSNSPAVAADGTIYIQSTDHYLYALNPADGSLKWRYNINSISYSSPVIAPDGTIYVGSSDNNLYAIYPDGRPKWTFPAGNQIYSTPALDAAGNIYFGTLGNTFFKVHDNGTNATRAWVAPYATGAAISSSPALNADGSVVYIGGYDHKLHAVYTATGFVKWTYTLGDEVRAGSPAIDANGVIYIGGYDKLLHAVNPADGTLLRTYAMGNWVRSSPVIAGTKLYVGCNDYKLYAFELGVGAANTPWPMYRQNPRRLGRTISPYLSNLSVRAAITPSQTLIVGFVVDGGAKPILVRAAGPALNHYISQGVTDPRLTLFNSASAAVASNDDWNSSLAPTFATLGAFAFDAASKDAALLQSIIGPDTAQATTTDSGIMLVEAYDAGPSDGRKLTNLSARFPVGTGDNILIAGFVLAGTGTKQVLVRAVGPTLAGYGVTSPLADPQLTVFDGATSVANNDNWSSALVAIFDTVGAFHLLDTSKDAALVVTLLAGKAYTVQVSGVNNTTGEALVEIYTLP